MNYPGLKKTYQKLPISHKNRGMNLENLINLSNNYYLEKDIAVIYKKPTPIGISKVDYQNKKVLIKEAYFETQSTLDYNGIYKGYYVDFDAKETTSKTSFPLDNIHKHQILHIRRIIKHGGLAFLIIKMNSNYFLLPGVSLIKFVDENKRKSIPYSYITNNSYIIKEGINPPLDYLKCLDKLIADKEIVWKKLI